MAVRRIEYLDGLRGLAAMQVVAEHYSTNFTGTSWHWLHFFTASDCAVFLFFLMSGFVLTPSFRKAPDAIVLNMQKRVIRLGLPMIAALVFALIFYKAAPDIAAQAAAVSHAGVDQVRHLHDISVSTYLTDLFGGTLFVGFKETGLVPLLAEHMPSVRTSMDPPIWSLHVELWGSLLVLLLVWASTKSKRIYAFVSIAAAAIVGINALVLFLIGHFCAKALDTDFYERYSTKTAVQWIAGLLVVAGMIMCSRVDVHGIWFLRHLLDHGVLHPNYDMWWPTEFGAIVLFIGILLSPLVHRFLSLPLPRYLGRLSFPVYLVHWPIMMVIGSYTYVWTHSFGPHIAAAAALIVGLSTTLVAAELFERWCDQPAVAFGRNFGKLEKAVPAT
jgi:peptidoglycan/LPS O-acetylase OafA/YrhL